MSGRTSVGASDPVAFDAAEELALSGASPLSCVLAGYFAAAGAWPGVLLGPMSLLIHSFGADRAMDGRVRQPGLEQKRPRGYLPSQDVPDAARVGVPTGVTAALVALGYDRERRIAAILKAGIAHARRLEQLPRLRVLERISSAGAGAFSDPALSRPLLHAGGPSQGGSLSPADFKAVPAVDYAAVRVALGGGAERLVVPWADEQAPTPGVAFVGAIGRDGSAAVLCYRRVESGLDIPELGLLAPLCAVPVRRGVSRIRPGSALPEPAPIQICLTKEGRVQEVREAAAERPDAFRVLAPSQR